MGKFNFNLENKKLLIQQSLVESPDGACCSAIIWLYAESKFAFYAIDCIKGQMLISVYLALDNLHCLELALVTLLKFLTFRKTTSRKQCLVLLFTFR